MVDHEYSCAEMSLREINAALHDLPDGATVRITEPRGLHNLAVGLTNKITIEIDGNAGYFIGGLCDGPDITVNGSVGWSVGENLMSGSVRVKGNASESAAASAHGGTVIIEGNASSRAAISLKGGTLCVAGSVGHMSAFMAQAGTLLVGGDAQGSLGDSLYEAVIYVGGSISSLGADTKEDEMTEVDVKTVNDLIALSGFDHIDVGSITKIVSAKTLYNFDALKDQKY